MAWKAAGRHSMAFVILNRFLDIADAREDPGVHSLAEVENADFANTGEVQPRFVMLGLTLTGWLCARTQSHMKDGQVRLCCQPDSQQSKRWVTCLLAADTHELFAGVLQTSLTTWHCLSSRTPQTRTGKRYAATFPVAVWDAPAACSVCSCSPC